jgi:hypothetical protein
VLAGVVPVVSNTFNATAYDGVTDFGGTSGVSYLSLLASDNLNGNVAPVDWAGWIGLGDVTLPVDAVGLSGGTGAGNLIQQFDTDAGADFLITYTYDAAGVPEPGSIAMSALVLLGAAGVWRHCRSQKI